MLYWLLSTEAYQQRLLREIRLARTPITARSRERGSEERTLPVAYDVKAGTATIRVEGVLTPTPDMQAEFHGEPNTTYPDLQGALAEAVAKYRTGKIKEVVWDVNSPGGSVDGFYALLDDIASARAAGVKMRVDAYNAHSAAYGIAAAAGKITAMSRATSVGSVGVATSLFMQGGMCGEVIDVTNSDAPEKRPNPKTPEGREVLTRYLDQLAAPFYEAIAEGRGVTRDHVALKYGRGSSMLAPAALEAGLIDSVAPRPSAYARTLTDTRKSGTVRGSMADTHPEPIDSEPVATEAPAAVEASDAARTPEAIPVTIDLSDEDRAELAALRAERAARETAERRELVTALVALGAETPATAWRDNAPVARLALEPLADLRARVTALRAAKPVAVQPPSVGGEDGLEDFERRDAAKIKDPDARARFVAARLARKQKAQ